MVLCVSIFLTATGSPHQKKLEEKLAKSRSLRDPTWH
jgi:hypothetical protein